MDSNPRWACAHNGFRDRPVQPLRHLSTEKIPYKSIVSGKVKIRQYPSVPPISKFSKVKVALKVAQATEKKNDLQ